MKYNIYRDYAGVNSRGALGRVVQAVDVCCGAPPHTAAGKEMKYKNRHYGFPVKTQQEQELVIPRLERVEKTADGVAGYYKYSDEVDKGFLF